MPLSLFGTAPNVSAPWRHHVQAAVVHWIDPLDRTDSDLYRRVQDARS